MKLFGWKSRKYPIKRDEYGRSARQQAFVLFGKGYRPSQIDKQEMIPASIKTLFRYYEDWKKLPYNFELKYLTLKMMRQNDTEFSHKVVQDLAEFLGMSWEEAITRLHKPWALKQLLCGEWPNYRMEKVQSEQERRLKAALELISMHEKLGVTPEEITEALCKLRTTALGRNQARRG